MKTHLVASCLGNFARDSLLKATLGKIMGVTSKGVFLLFGKSSLFLTHDTHMSPFNIILSPENALPRKLSIGAPVYYSQGDLLIPDCQLTISLVDTPVWTPPPPCPLNASRAEQVSNARIIYQGLQNFDPQKGFLFLVNKATADTPEQTQIRQSVKSFSKAFIGNDLQTCLQAAAHLFGLGTGLTPSGDDWITGFMLYQCCQEIATKKAPRPFITSLGAELVFTAYHQTTWISANRIEAALKGWSEDLFLSAVNFIFDPSTGAHEKIVDGLYHFGHSSGVDTFTGIAYACQDW